MNRLSLYERVYGRDSSTPFKGGVKFVSVGDFIIWAAKSGLRASIEDICNTPEHPLRSSSLALRDFLTNGGLGYFDMDNGDNMEMLDAWVLAGIVSTEQKQDLLSLIKVS
jgi:hypothetical protein